MKQGQQVLLTSLQGARKVDALLLAHPTVGSLIDLLAQLGGGRVLAAHLLSQRRQDVADHQLCLCATVGSDFLPEELGDIRPTCGLIDDVAPFQTQPFRRHHQSTAEDDLPHHAGDTDDAEETDTGDTSEHVEERGTRLIRDQNDPNPQRGEADAAQKASPETHRGLRNNEHPGAAQLLAHLANSSGIDSHVTRLLTPHRYDGYAPPP